MLSKNYMDKQQRCIECFVNEHNKGIEKVCTFILAFQL